MATFNPLDPFGSLADFMCEGAIEGWKKTASWVLTSGALGDAQWTVANDTLNHVAGVMGFVAVGVGAYSIVKNAIRGRAGEVFASLFATVLAWPLTVVCATLLVRGVSVGDKLTSKILEWNSPAFDAIDLDANVFGDVFGVAFALILALLIVIGGVAATTISAPVAFTYTSGDMVINLQEILDKIMPNLVPLVIALVSYLLVSKKGWSANKLIVAILIFAAVMVVTGIM